MGNYDLSKYCVLFDDEIGLVWLPELGVIRTTSIEHAKAISDIFEQYKEGKVDDNDIQRLIKYLENDDKETRIEIKERTVKENLLSRNSIERLEILLTNDCNLACKYCYAHEGTYRLKKSKMTPVDSMKYLTALINFGFNGFESVLFFGGEPTLCPDTITSVCEFFYKAYEQKTVTKMPDFLMVTNCTLIDDRLADIIKKYDITLTISLDGPKEITDVLRVDKSGRGIFDRVLKCIEVLKSKDIDIALVEVTYTSLHEKMGYTKKDVENFVKDNLGINNVAIADCEDIGGNEQYAYYETNAETPDVGGFGRNKILSRMHNHNYTGVVCESGYGSVSMTPNGNLYPCHFFVSDETYLIARYNNGKYDFSEYKSFLANFKQVDHFENEKCKNCWVRFTCTMCATGVAIQNMQDCEMIKKRQEKVLFKIAKNQIETGEYVTC